MESITGQEERDGAVTERLQSYSCPICEKKYPRLPIAVVILREHYQGHAWWLRKLYEWFEVADARYLSEGRGPFQGTDSGSLAVGRVDEDGVGEEILNSSSRPDEPLAGDYLPHVPGMLARGGASGQS